MTQQIKTGDSFTLSFRFHTDTKTGKVSRQAARTITRTVRRVYNDGGVLDSAYEKYFLKRTSQGLVAVALLLMFVGCAPITSKIDKPEILTPTDSTEPLIRTLTENGCHISTYKSRGAVKEVIVTCQNQ